MATNEQEASAEAKIALSGGGGGPVQRPLIDESNPLGKRSAGRSQRNVAVATDSQAITVDLTNADSVEVTISEPADLRLVRWAEVMPRVSLVIPARNEATNLPHVLKKVPRWVYEIILVDGASVDGTVEVARALHPGIKVIPQDGTGKGAAMCQGFEAATGDIIAVMDADGSMDATELYAMVGQLMCGADLVKGSRFLQGGGSTDIEWYRRSGNLGLVWLTRVLYRARLSDICYGYLAFWRQALDTLSPDASGFEIDALLNVRALKSGLKVVEVASFESPRIHGTSQLNTFRDGFRILRTILGERSRILDWLKVSP